MAEVYRVVVEHRLEVVARDLLTATIDARCSCGLLYPRVTEEQEVREGILAVMQRIHEEDMREALARVCVRGSLFGGSPVVREEGF